ncbi:PAS domain S-box protein [Sphingobium yanoikuyae]|jgi:two-component system sensor kinase FixL|uniref:PAS domain S-box protein n=1 Tax=Sphingobium yanoikuyae TaxID=13690 RepID=UPI00289AEB38|nr:PAS domain S-box protein [Sphingobium yanoikuyae]
MFAAVRRFNIIPISKAGQVRASFSLVRLRCLRRHVSWSGVSRYLVGLAMVAIALAAFQADEYPSFSSEFYVIFTFVALFTTMLFGAGPGFLAGIAALAVTYLLEGFHGGLLAAGAFLMALVAANVVALRATFWRARAEYQAAHVGRLMTQMKLLTDGAAHYALYMTDVSGFILHWNRGAERFTGWLTGEVMHRHVALLYPGRAEIKARMAQAFAFARQHGSWEFDHECCRSDGTIYLQNCVVTALYDNDGALQGFANLIRDVTLERAHELALQEREHELRLILETAPDAVFVFDADGCIEYINEAASRMFGYDLVDLKGQNFESLLLVCPSEDEVPDEYPFRIVDVSEKIERQLIGRHHNGSNFPTEMTFVRMEANGGTRFTAFVRDLSEQEATKARLETLQAEMLDGTRYSAMGAMASMLSHELTQPLTALAAYMEGGSILLNNLNGGSRAKLDEIFHLASSEAVRAGAIMRHLRDFTSSGEAQLEVQDIGEMVRSSIALVRPAAARAQVRVVLRVAPDAGPVFADPVQIQQVIGNLCRNAIDAMRNMDERILTIHASRVDELTTQVMITDTGSGIAAEIRERLFDAFVTTKEEGTGVGLSICRTIVEAHGGRIWVEPAPAGSCFCFTLKRKKGILCGGNEDDSHRGRRIFRQSGNGILVGA